MPNSQHKMLANVSGRAGARLLCFAGLVLLFNGLVCKTVSAQEVKKTIADYFSGPITYSPADPWTRGKVFNWHTGHAGRFYNCDNEECKRNSPYICWKAHYENDIPQRRGLWRGLKMDIAEVRQRVCDGAGPCCDDGCQCADCVAQNHHANSARPIVQTNPAFEAPTARRRLVEMKVHSGNAKASEATSQPGKTSLRTAEKRHGLLSDTIHR